MIELSLGRLFCCSAWQQLLFLNVDEPIVRGSFPCHQWPGSAFVFKDLLERLRSKGDAQKERLQCCAQALERRSLSPAGAMSLTIQWLQVAWATVRVDTVILE